MQKTLIVVALLLLTQHIPTNADRSIVPTLELESNIYFFLKVRALHHSKTLFTTADLSKVTVGIRSGKITESAVVNYRNPVNEWLHITYELYGLRTEPEILAATLVTEDDAGALAVIELDVREQWFHKERGVLRVRAFQKQVSVGDPPTWYFRRNVDILVYYAE